MEKNIIKVPIADAEYTTDRHAVLKARNVGSCIALAALDRANMVGGLLHVLLPDARIDPFSADTIAFNPYKYISSGVSLYLRHIFDMGATHDTLCLYAFGGAELVPDTMDFKLGHRNIVTLRRSLWQEGVLLTKYDFGGDTPRSIQLDMDEQVIHMRNRKGGSTTYEP